METLIYIKSLIVTIITDHLSAKVVSSVVFTLGTFFFAGLSSKALVALLVLIIIDYVTAIWNQHREGHLISSKLSIKTPIKVLAYYTMIASGHLVEYGIPAQVQFIDDTILTFLLITEFLSVLRHFSSLGYKTPSKLINQLREQVGEKAIADNK